MYRRGGKYKQKGQSKAVRPMRRQPVAKNLPADTTSAPVTASLLVSLLQEKNLTLSTCESCTGGLLAAAITSVPGVSAVYAGGFVTYTVRTKHELAGVSGKLLKKEGAVSARTARQMAKKTAAKTSTDCALSVTGNAGPDPSEGKPVGLVYIGCTLGEKTFVQECHFEGDRAGIRQQAVQEAIRLLYDALTQEDSESQQESNYHHFQRTHHARKQRF